MANLTTRAGKGAALTHQEVDDNFTGLNTELGQKEVAANKGVANGYASLDASGRVPSGQLPSYVDDVLEFANLAAFPATGETGKIYVALDTNKVHRWSGSAYVEISASPGSTDSVAEGTTNLYFTQARARASVSASGSLAYNSGTGVFSYTQPTNVSTFTNDAGYITSSASITGNAETATRLQTGRTIAVTGDVTGTSVAFDGSANLSFATTLANSGVTAGTYGSSSAVPVVTVDAKGRVTGVSTSAISGSLTFTGDVTGSGTTGGSTTLTLANSGVTAGSYGSASAIPVITVDAKGRLTGVSTSAVSIPSGSLTFTGDVTGSGTTGSSTALTLANSGVTAGTYTKVTVDAKGRVTTGASLASGDLPTYTGTLTSAQVTTALGFTPYNSTNPAGYITSASLSSYLPLSGGTISGTIGFSRNDNQRLIESYNTSAGSPVQFFIEHNLGNVSIGNARGNINISSGNLLHGGNQVLHAGNHTSYAMALRGDNFVIADWNALTGIGCYRVAPDGADANGPPINQYGNLLVFGSDNGRTQLQAGHDGRLAWRTKWNASDWTAWFTALDSGNYSNYFKTVNGNSIIGSGDVTITASDNTKLPLAGGTLTGSISFAQGANINFGTSTNEAGPWTISVIGSGGATPATKGTGRGRDLIVKAGNSDNTAGYAGGDLYLRGGYPTSPSVTYGDVRIADLGGQIFVGNNYLRISSDNTDWASGNYFRGTSTHFVLGVQNTGTLYLNYGNSGGTCRIDGSTWSPSFYDMDNSAYYLNPAGSSNLSGTVTVNGGKLLVLSDSGGYGQVQINSSNTSTEATLLFGSGGSGQNSGGYTYAGVIGLGAYGLSKSNLYFGCSYSGPAFFIPWTGDYAQASGSFRAPIFYDSNDTGYYTNPNSMSSMYGVAIRGDTSSTDTSNQIFFWGSGNTTTSAIGFKANGGNFPNPTGNGDGYNTYLTMDTPGRGWVFREGVGGSNFGSAYTSGWILNNGIWQANASMRSPIFYDSNNTAYYLDPSSSFNFLVTSGTTFYSGGSGVYINNPEGNGQTLRMGAAWSKTGIYCANDITVGSESTINFWTQGVARGYFDSSSNFFANGSARSPIFYDSNDTGYYIDAASASSMSEIRFNGTTSRRMYGASLGAGYNAVRFEGNWDNFDVMGRVIDWTGSNLHFGDGYNGTSHSGTYFKIGTVSYLRVGGDIYADGNVVAYYSDARLKQNIETIPNALEILGKIRGVTFEWNKKSEEVWSRKEGEKDFGLISQEVEAVFPMGVAVQCAADRNLDAGYGDPNSPNYDPLHKRDNEDEQYKTVKYDKLVALAIQAINEQQKQISKMFAEINSLKERLH